MFTKVFIQIFDSSIAEDPHLRHFFMDMLVLADRDGVVDMTPTAIAARTRLPLDEVKGYLDRLEKPDPESRNPEEDGRRLVKIDMRRTWGWRVTNYEKYRRIGSKEDSNEKARVRMERHRERNAGMNGGGVTGPAVEPAGLPSGQSIEGFEQFWAAYPKKVARFDAERVFVEFHAKDRMPEILAALSWQVKSADWKKERGQYIPTPANYLRDGRWNDVKPRPVRNGPNINELDNQ